MELYRPGFESKEACIRAGSELVGIYEAAHEKNALIGPVDFNRICFDPKSGEVVSFPSETVSRNECGYDLWKFLPDEYMAGLEWDLTQDLYCLAVLLFAVKTGSLPFDGLEECTSFSLSEEERKEKYRTLGFIFAEGAGSNRADPLINTSAIDAWNDEKNEELEALFTKVFTNRSDKVCRPVVAEWRAFFAANGSSAAEKTPAEDKTEAVTGKSFALKTDDVSITLAYGTKIGLEEIYAKATGDFAVVLGKDDDKDDIWLGNTSEMTWTVDVPDGSRLLVEPQTVAPIEDGVVIDTGYGKARIVSER